MERKKINGVFKTRGKEYSESFEMGYQEDAEKAYREMLETYNSEEYWRKKQRPEYLTGIREFVSASWDKSDNVVYCDFEKQNGVTIREGGKLFDRYKCKSCGRVRRRFGLSDIPIVKCIDQERRVSPMGDDIQELEEERI